jgi:hypothetical protein
MLTSEDPPSGGWLTGWRHPTGTGAVLCGGLSLVLAAVPPGSSRPDRQHLVDTAQRQKPTLPSLPDLNGPSREVRGWPLELGPIAADVLTTRAAAVSSKQGGCWQLCSYVDTRATFNNVNTRPPGPANPPQPREPRPTLPWPPRRPKRAANTRRSSG